MQIVLQHDHPWDVSPDEAKAIQRRLGSAVDPAPLPDAVETVAGIDVRN